MVVCGYPPTARADTWGEHARSRAARSGDAWYCLRLARAHAFAGRDLSDGSTQPPSPVGHRRSRWQQCVAVEATDARKTRAVGDGAAWKDTLEWGLCPRSPLGPRARAVKISGKRATPSRYSNPAAVSYCSRPRASSGWTPVKFSSGQPESLPGYERLVDAASPPAPRSTRYAKENCKRAVCT